jgi:hypothetical protein
MSSPSARVTSIDALRDFRAGLCKFGLTAREALCVTDLEIRRFLDWLDTQQKYWKHEVRRREEDVHRARAELSVRKFYHETGRGTTEPEIALRKAQERLREAEEKVRNVRRWLNELPRAITEYEGPARQLSGMLDADLTRALARLGQKLEALDAYLASTGLGPEPEAPVSTAPATAGEATEAAPGEEGS